MMDIRFVSMLAVLWAASPAGAFQNSTDNYNGARQALQTLVEEAAQTNAISEDVQADVMRDEFTQDSVEVAYQFSDCKRPVEPVLATDKSSKGRVTVAARNRAVTQYNEHVKASNAYMRCITDESQRDLDAYYKAVSTALDAEQADVMGDLERLRQGLNKRR